MVATSSTPTPPTAHPRLTPAEVAKYHAEGYHIFREPVFSPAKFNGLKTCFEHILDNLDTGSLQNIEHIRHERFDFRNVDVTDHMDVEGQVDYVFHLASPASPIDYLRLPLHTLKVGSYGTHHALGLAKFKRARLLLASTSEVYGDPEVHPQPETYWGNVNPLGPRGVYDEAKRYAEALA